MKTKLFFYTCFALSLLVFNNNLYSQNFYESSTEITSFGNTLDIDHEFTLNSDEKSFNFIEIANSVDDTLTLDEEEQDPEQLIRFARTMLALGAGIAFGDSDTLYCLHAAYYLRLAMYTNAALFGSLGVAFDGLSGDNFTRNLIDLQFRLLMFHAITKYKQVHFIYGMMLAYAFGSEKFDGGSKYDLTRLTAALVLGFNIILTTQFSIMLQTNIFAHQRWTQKLNGSEIENNTTWGYINKGNLLTLSLVWNLANSRAR
ncbi:hypothetical protein [Seonamhaeicola sp. ML3]|uniref:hypothetical protein n=1 Tax=Seonamhaeicola sp. ML3 TaxID=2937786 RepID=UPI00200BB133|nr:hypothetical protein [Seonamhaeicola sp. ML3]